MKAHQQGVEQGWRAGLGVFKVSWVQGKTYLTKRWRRGVGAAQLRLSPRAFTCMDRATWVKHCKPAWHEQARFASSQLVVICGPMSATAMYVRRRAQSERFAVRNYCNLTHEAILGLGWESVEGHCWH